MSDFGIIDKRDLVKMTGIPASVGICEPIEGFAERPDFIFGCMKEMASELTAARDEAERAFCGWRAARAQQPNLSRIAQKKLEQMGATVHGVLAKNDAGAWAAVSDAGRVMWLDGFEGQPDEEGRR